MEESSATYVQLLGGTRIRLGQAWHSFVPDKRHQLLAYLAYYGDWVSRERLAFLFWPDVETQHAKQNLRGLLQRVRTLGWLSGLQTNTHQLCWSVKTDVGAFRQAVEKNHLDEATSLYTGPLLHSLESDEAPEFSDWLEMEREHLHTQWRDILVRRVKELQSSAHEEEAVKLLGRLLESDPLDEEALQAYMRAAAHAGQQEGALRAYRSFSKRLLDDMGMEATSTTQRLAQAIQEAKVEHPPLDHVSSRPPATPANVVSPSIPNTANARPASLPVSTTSFVGRDLELGEITQLLSKPECRLLTLLGPGGVGKTRLALQAASELKAAYEDGAFFVPLDSLTSTAGIPLGIATALGLELQGQAEPLAQVACHLADKHVFLLLDNFEHLLEGSITASDLLHSCPNLKLLVTSRERLNLEEEWVFSVEGLAYPEQGIPLDMALAYDAIQLFTQRVQRVQPSFNLSEENLPHVLKICQLVQGLPLGLELAATWVRAMPVEEIAQEIEQNLDILSSQSRNVNERHRSIRATFESSWKLLSDAEQQVLRKLSVFRGGFRREAAAVVADASVAVLAALLDKSLLRLSSGRYDRHPLIYQYTQEKLAEHPEEQARVQEAHGKYYYTFLRHQEADLYGGDEKRGLLLIEKEVENLRTAWDWLIDARPSDLKRISEPFYAYFGLRGHYQEGADLFSQTAARLDNPDATSRDDSALGDALIRQAWFCVLLSEHKTSRALAQRGLELVSFPEDCIPFLVGLNTLAVVANATGSYAEAKEHREELSRLLREIRAKGYLPTNLATAALAANLGNTASIEVPLGNYSQAKSNYQESLALNRQMGRSHGVASSLIDLGYVLLLMGQPADALTAVKQGLELAQELGDARQIATALCTLAAAYLELGELNKAQELSQQALQAAQESEAVSAVARLAKVRAETRVKNKVAEELTVFVELLQRWNTILAEVMPPEAYAALQKRFERDLSEISTRQLECHTVSVTAARD